MSILDAYESGEHRSNIAHYAAIVKLALVDGPINEGEESVLKRLAFKLDVTDEEAKQIFKDPEKYPLIAPYTLEERKERLHDLCRTIFADHKIDDEERALVFKYAIGLGFSNGKATEEIENCFKLFNGEVELED